MASEVFSYVLTIAGLNDEDVEVLHKERITSIINIQVMGMRNWEGLSADVHPVVEATLQAIYKWTLWYGKGHNGIIPLTLEEWQTEFNVLYVMDITKPEISPPSSVVTKVVTETANLEELDIPRSSVVKSEGVKPSYEKSLPVPTLKKEPSDSGSKHGSDDDSDSSLGEIKLPSKTHASRISVKLQDFPMFTSTHDDWERFRYEFEAAAGLSHLVDLLDVEDKIGHMRLKLTSTSYREAVKELYYILKRKCSRGLAQTMLVKHKNDCDGVLFWETLQEYYGL